MHLRFTDDELWTMAEMLHLAFWAASWNRKSTAEPQLARYDALLQKMLEKAKNAGHADKLVWNEERKGLAIREDVQEKSFFTECYDEFRAESFWEEILLRMAERDLITDIGSSAFLKLSDEEKRVRLEPIEKRYWAEFEKNGVERLHLIYDSEES